MARAGQAPGTVQGTSMARQSRPRSSPPALTDRSTLEEDEHALVRGVRPNEQRQYGDDLKENYRVIIDKFLWLPELQALRRLNYEI